MKKQLILLVTIAALATGSVFAAAEDMVEFQSLDGGLRVIMPRSACIGYHHIKEEIRKKGGGLRGDYSINTSGRQSDMPWSDFQAELDSGRRQFFIIFRSHRLMAEPATALRFVAGKDVMATVPAQMIMDNGNGTYMLSVDSVDLEAVSAESISDR